MVFLPRNPRKRPAPPPEPETEAPRTNPGASSAIDAAAALLADAGCTLLVPPHQAPSLPSPHSFAARLERTLSAGRDAATSPSAPARRLLEGLAAFAASSPARLRQLLLPAAPHAPSLARALLSVPALQPGLLALLLEKLPEHFDGSGALDGLPLQDDVGRLIVSQFRWLDFLVDADAFVGKLVEVLSVAPPRLKKEIIGSLPEIVGDQSHAAVVAALEKLLQEDSEIVVAVLDVLSDLNLNEDLQEQAVTVAISCIRTIAPDQMPHLLRFLLLSATPANAGRIILQIREQLKFVGVVDPRAARSKKLKGKASANSTDGAILDTLRSALRFKNMLCEAFLKELKSVDHPRDHKVIDVWLIMLIYANGGALQKSAEKILKSKILQECIRETLFDQCIHGNTELVKEHFMSYLSVSDYLLACKEEKAREFAAYLFTALFEEFSDTYSRQELVGSLVAHIGSGVSYEVSSALDIMISLASNNSEELIPISSHITGILDYLESFHEDNLRKVYDIFCRLALSAGFNTGSGGSSVYNELLMVVRKQISNPDMKYRRMGIIGVLKIISTIATTDVNAVVNCSSSQQPNYEEALELLKMSINSCKFVTLPLMFLYDELAALLESKVIHSSIHEWVGEHAAELFDTSFLADLENGELPDKCLCDGIEGELWMKLDGNISPVCVNIMPLASTAPQKSQSCLQILLSQFSLLTTIERLGNEGSLGGINALLGCPLHLPSTKHWDGAKWGNLSGSQKKAVCYSLYYAINWIRELLNAFSTQVESRVDNVSQKARDETAVKLLKRLRNLILLEGLLNAFLKRYPLSLPELRYLGNCSGSTSTSKFNIPKNMGEESINGASSKRQKGCKGKASEKMNPDDKLKQSTILDAFKRAGVIVSQATNKASSQPSSNGMMSKDIEQDANDPGELGLIDLMAAPVKLDMQRFKFRTLHTTCLSLLNYSECQDSSCSYLETELPIHLYLLRDLHNKLDNLNPSTKPFLSTSQAKYAHTHCHKSTQEFLEKIQPLFLVLRKHLDGAVSMLKDESESCPDNWSSHSSSAGNPDIPFVVVSKSSIVTAICKEILGCYRKLLAIPDLLNQPNMSVLKQLLQTLQPTENFDDVLSEFQPSLAPCNVDYLYCGACKMLEDIMEPVSSFSYLLSSDVLITIQSIVNSVVVFLEKSGEPNGKNTNMGCSKAIIPFLRKRLGYSAHKLLTTDFPSEDAENGWQSKGDLIQKILQIYLRNSDSTSDLLVELGQALPKAPSLKTNGTQDAPNRFPTLCFSTVPSWYRVLHDENTASLNRTIKQALKTRALPERGSVDTILQEIQKSVKAFVSLIEVCKTHEKVSMHAMAVKHGGKFIDTFLKAFNFLETHFKQHNGTIFEMLKELQKATRIIQTICSEAKVNKRTMITSKVPPAKRSMERFLFQVKALLEHCSTDKKFWMGNLRHKDLQGHVVSSQVYGSVDDDDEEQTEAESDTPAEENDNNAMDEDVVEGSNETPMEEE